MTRFNNLTYYEMLEIPVNASAFEIREAYKDALTIYDKDSFVTYSLFSNEARDEILQEIEEAFRTLIDVKSRESYNRMIVESGKVNEYAFTKKDKKNPIPIFGIHKSTRGVKPIKRIDNRIKNKQAKEISEQILSKEKITGEDLKKLRKATGIELEELYEVTRIRISILKAIESNPLENPAPSTYLKGFLKTYANFFQIDHKRLIEGYLMNLE